MTRQIWTILLLMLCCCIVTLHAEDVKVTMKSGSTMTGELKELVPTDHVTLIIAGVESVISMEEVAPIEKMEVEQVEWCHDYWAMFTSNDQFDPHGSSSGDNYVLRRFAPDNEKWERIQNNEEYFGNRYARIAISADEI